MKSKIRKHWFLHKTPNLKITVLFILFLGCTIANAQEKPNIVFFLVDDLGYSDVGYMNQKPEIKTPNIDKLAATGTPLEYKNHKVEGINLWPAIIAGEKPKGRGIFWHYPHHRHNEKSMAAAVREGDWKLIYEFESEDISLFNLKNDVGETNNLADKFPEKAKLLHKKLESWQSEVNAAMPKPKGLEGTRLIVVSVCFVHERSTKNSRMIDEILFMMYFY